MDPSCTTPPCEPHPGAEFCIRSIAISKSGGGQQCCYKSGTLLLGPPGGGTVDTCHYSKKECHYNADVLPWEKCCKNKSIESCKKYYEKRPSDDGTNYKPPN